MTFSSKLRLRKTDLQSFRCFRLPSGGVRHCGVPIYLRNYRVAHQRLSREPRRAECTVTFERSEVTVHFIDIFRLTLSAGHYNYIISWQSCLRVSELYSDADCSKSTLITKNCEHGFELNLAIDEKIEGLHPPRKPGDSTDS